MQTEGLATHHAHRGPVLPPPVEPSRSPRMQSPPPPPRRPSSSFVASLSLSDQRRLAIVEALLRFLDSVRARRYRVFELDRSGIRVLLPPHRQQDFLQRCITGAPRQIPLSICRCRAVLKVNTRDFAVELLDERDRIAAGGHKVAKVDVRHVAPGDRERLIKR